MGTKTFKFHNKYAAKVACILLCGALVFAGGTDARADDALTPAYIFVSAPLLFTGENAEGYRVKEASAENDTLPVSSITVYPAPARVGLDISYRTEEAPVFNRLQTMVFVSTIIPLQPQSH